MKKRNLLILAISVIFFIYNLQLFAVENNNNAGASNSEFTKVGGAGGQFLKIGVGGRASGMAGAYTSLSGDLSSLYWNPAGISDIHGYSAYFSYTQWFADFSQSFAAACLPIGNDFIAALQITSFSSGDIEVTTLESSNLNGQHYTNNDYSIGFTFAGKLTEQFSFGITAKYLANAIAAESATGVAFDIGTLYDTGIQGIKLAFTLKNLGTQETYSGTDL